MGLSRRRFLAGIVNAAAAVTIANPLEAVAQQLVPRRVAAPVLKTVSPEGVKTEILATDVTAKNFSILQHAHEWADGRVRKIIFISPEEIRGRAFSETLINSKKTDAQGMTLAAFRAYLQKNDNFSAIKEEVKIYLKGILPSDVMQLIDNQKIEELTGYLVSGGESSSRFNRDVTTTDGDIALITTPFADATKELLGAQMASLPRSAIENVSGTDGERRAHVLMHGVAHVIQTPTPFPSLPQETRSDLGARIFYAMELKRGSVKTPNVPDDFLRERAIASVIDINMEVHMTNAAIRSAGDGNPPKGTDKDFIDGLSYLRTQVALEVWGQGGSMASHAVFLNKILNGEPVIEGAEVLSLTVKDEDIIRKMLRALSDDLSQYLELREQLSENIKKKVSDLMTESNISQGYELMKFNLPLIYKSVANIYDESTLDDNGFAKQYAWEFLVAVQKHAPTHFDVGPNPKTFAPPVFTEDGKYVTPAAPAPAP